MKTAIVVDDDNLNLFITVELLKELGFDVFSFNLPERAIDFSFDKKIDLLVADISLPKIKGDKLAIRIQKKQPEARVLLISGYEKEDVELNGFEFLQKPFTFDVFKTAIGNLFKTLSIETSTRTLETKEKKDVRRSFNPLQAVS